MSTSMPLKLLHMDLFGPTTYRSIGENSYGLVVMDDFSKRLEVIIALSSRTLELNIIVIKRESNMNFQPSTLRNKMELLKGRIGL
jgi:hypothetical protein